MSNPCDDEYWEYEMGLEGEYDYTLPPDYESWAEWHFINGDRMPDESDYYEEVVEEDTDIDDYTYDEKTDTYYSPSTGKRLTQKQLDAESDKGTARIYAIIARLEERNRIYEEVRKRREQRNSQNNNGSEEQIKWNTNTKSGDIFDKADAWLHRHPCIYNGIIYTSIIVVILCIAFVIWIDSLY